MKYLILLLLASSALADVQTSSDAITVTGQRVTKATLDGASLKVHRISPKKVVLSCRMPTYPCAGFEFTEGEHELRLNNHSPTTVAVPPANIPPGPADAPPPNQSPVAATPMPPNQSPTPIGGQP
jgi:hypothetical protein